jgi:hypothetical protein
MAAAAAAAERAARRACRSPAGAAGWCRGRPAAVPATSCAAMHPPRALHSSAAATCARQLGSRGTAQHPPSRAAAGQPLGAPQPPRPQAHLQPLHARLRLGQLPAVVRAHGGRLGLQLQQLALQLAHATRVRHCGEKGRPSAGAKAGGCAARQAARRQRARPQALPAPAAAAHPPARPPLAAPPARPPSASQSCAAPARPSPRAPAAPRWRPSGGIRCLGAFGGLAEVCGRGVRCGRGS